jgi:hypothetical protein
VTWTTYCWKHNTLETVDQVNEVHGFVVEEHDWLTRFPRKTNRAACDVRGVTDKGCKVHFIGGPKWSGRD